MSGGQFEAVKCGLRQSKDGVVISLVVHPNDVTADLMNLPIGTRVAVEWAEMTDEEPNTPAPGAEQSEGGDADQTVSAAYIEKPRQPVEDVAFPPSRPATSKRRFSELPLSQQCAIRCSDERFWQMWRDRTGRKIHSEEEMAERIRAECGIETRSELDTSDSAGLWWRGHEAYFQNWLLEQQHGELVR